MDKIVFAKKINELKKNLQKHRFDLTLSKLKDVNKIKQVRKEIARLFTDFNNKKKGKK
jgi:ribosomal protein L29